MNDFKEENDLMRAEDWKAMYMMLFRAQTGVLEQASMLSLVEMTDILKKAMQKRRGVLYRQGRCRGVMAPDIGAKFLQNTTFSR